MSRSLKILAFASGIFLGIALVYIAGYLAAIAVPKSYFAYFGREHATIALVLEEAVTTAIPTFLITLAWGYASLYRMRLSPWRAMLWSLAGLLVVYVAVDTYVVQQFIDMPMPDGAQKYPLGTFLVNMFVPQPWSILNFLAAPLGLLAAGALLRGGGAQPGIKKPPTASAVGA